MVILINILSVSVFNPMGPVHELGFHIKEDEKPTVTNCFYFLYELAEIFNYHIVC